MPRAVQIIPYYAQPHVHTVINDNSFYTEDVGTVEVQEKPYNTLVVTGADRGIDNKFVKLTDYETKVEIFGKANFQKYGQPSIQADVLLKNGRTNVWFMRVLPDDALYANLAVVAHYRIPKGIRENWTDEEIAADTTGDCEIRVPGGTSTAPTMVPTGLKQMEVKFSIVRVTKAMKDLGINTNGALTDADIEDFLTGKMVDPTTGEYRYKLPRGVEYTAAQAAIYGRTPEELEGYYSAPVFYVRSIGRGKYGNKYSLRLQRDIEFENDNEIKAYGFGLIERDLVSQAKHYFVGSIVNSAHYNESTLIDDVVGAYSTGSCPVHIKTYENTVYDMFDCYRKVVEYNAGVIAQRYADDQNRQLDLEYAKTLLGDSYENIDQFDPIFGYRLGETDVMLPFYANYTKEATATKINPTLTFQDYLPVSLDKDTTDTTIWNAFVSTGDADLLVKEGNTVLVKNYLGTVGQYGGVHDDNRLHRIFTIKDISAIRDTTQTPSPITAIAVTYDEGTWVSLDEAEYNGVDLTINIGHQFGGGFDGEFEQILAKPKKGTAWSEVVGDEVLRAPTDAELKLLLSREYVRALRGEKDRYILSPARINLDFIIDANYNICTSVDTATMNSDSARIRALFANSQVLTDEDYRQLLILDTGYQFNNNIKGTNGINTVADALNVKKALYDLNNYRNKNGMVLSKEEGAGCELKLDCGLVGLAKTSEVSAELRNLLNVMSQFVGRNCSVDLGHYETVDPVSKRKINVTVGYFLAEKLIPHIDSFGLNKPFVNKYAQVTNVVRNTFKPEIDLIDWDVKELLYKNRINYYVTLDEGRVVERACQNTCQKDASALLEENNTRVLNYLKKDLEARCRGYGYEWNDPTVRKSFTDTVMEIYRPWIGNYVEDLVIRFEANEFEQDRMIMHCYVEVKFRDIIKRVILEIDISKPNRGGKS